MAALLTWRDSEAPSRERTTFVGRDEIREQQSVAFPGPGKGRYWEGHSSAVSPKPRANGRNVFRRLLMRLSLSSFAIAVHVFIRQNAPLRVLAFCMPRSPHGHHGTLLLSPPACASSAMISAACVPALAFPRATEDSHFPCTPRLGDRDLGVCGLWLCSADRARACYNPVSFNFGFPVYVQRI